MEDSTRRIIKRFKKTGIRYKLKKQYQVEFLDGESECLGDQIIAEEQRNMELDENIEQIGLEKITEDIGTYIKKLKSLGYGDIIVIATSDCVKTYRSRATVLFTQEHV